jgi:hypothetical protein
VNQISGTTQTDAPTSAPAPQTATHGQQTETNVSPAADVQAPSGAPVADSDASVGAASEEVPGFRTRGSARRRARFLRKARELAYRDLGGLVFNLHRFGQRNDALVLAKLTTLTHIDTELRSIEAWLHERQPITVLREAGITACPRCAAIHSSEDSFCPNCGLPVSRHVDLPAGFQSGAAPMSTPAATPPAPTAPAPAPPAPLASAPAPPSATAPVTSGRSPTPPGASAPAPPAEDGQTEILRPPGAGA